MNDLMDDDDKMMSKKKSQSDSSTPVLDNFSRDLIKLAEQGKLDPVIGREKEIIRIAQILSRRKKNNPIIIGEPGCGKTAIIEGLAMKIFSGDCPKNLMDKRIVNLDINSVVAGTKYRGQFEERLKVIIEELGANPNIIVFIDEIHTIVGAGNASGSLDASNIFKPALARGEIQCIGAYLFFEAPGFNKTTLKVEVENGIIHIQGSRTYKLNGEEKTKSIEQQFTIGTDLNPESIEATIEDGLLTVFIPNFKKQEKKRVSLL